MSFTEHLLDNDTFGTDANGRWWARCLCGKRIGPYSNKAVVIDALMGHAYRMGQESKVKVGS